MANVKRSLCTHAGKKHSKQIGKEQSTRTKSTKITVEKANRIWIENIKTGVEKTHGTKNTFESLWYRYCRRDQRRLICCKTFSLLIAYLQSSHWLASPRHYIHLLDSMAFFHFIARYYFHDLISNWNCDFHIAQLSLLLLPMPTYAKSQKRCEIWAMNGCCECGGNYMVRC